MKKGESSPKGHGIKIAIGMMLCILIFLAGMLFFINNKLVDLQASVEKRISELEKRQNSIEQSLGFLKNIQPGFESLHEHREALKRKWRSSRRL